MNITNISVSRKQVWDDCHQKYKYQYHMKVPSPDKEPSECIYVTIVHKIAEEYVRCEGSKLIETVAHEVLSGKISLDKDQKIPELPAEYKKKIKEHIQNIKKFTDSTGFGGRLEYNFKYDLDPPNGKYVLGFIDRLIQKENKFWIVDYKTTKKGFWRKGLKEIKGDLQLRCYARVVQKEFNVPAENIKAALYYLDGAEVVGACFSEASLLSAEKELLDAYNAIEKKNADEVWGNVGNHCKLCSYKSICPFYDVAAL